MKNSNKLLLKSIASSFEYYAILKQAEKQNRAKKFQSSQNNKIKSNNSKQAN